MVLSARVVDQVVIEVEVCGDHGVGRASGDRMAVHVDAR